MTSITFYPNEHPFPPKNLTIKTAPSNTIPFPLSFLLINPIPTPLTPTSALTKRTMSSPTFVKLFQTHIFSIEFLCHTLDTEQIATPPTLPNKLPLENPPTPMTIPIIPLHFHLSPLQNPQFLLQRRSPIFIALRIVKHIGQRISGLLLEYCFGL